jgi:hypothetical protein
MGVRCSVVWPALCVALPAAASNKGRLVMVSMRAVGLSVRQVPAPPVADQRTRPRRRLAAVDVVRGEPAQARRRQWWPGTRHRRPAGHAAWPPRSGPSARACARPVCPPPEAATRENYPVSGPFVAGVLIHPTGESVKSAPTRASAGVPKYWGWATAVFRVIRVMLGSPVFQAEDDASRNTTLHGIERLSAQSGRGGGPGGPAAAAADERAQRPHCAGLALVAGQRARGAGTGAGLETPARWSVAAGAWLLAHRRLPRCAAAGGLVVLPP